MVGKDIQLRVADARQRDVGHGKVRIDNDTMQQLGITAGDFVEIHGKKMTVAVAWPAHAEDQAEEIVRMDGLIRRNTGVALNEYVVLKNADVKEAQAIIFAPTDVRLSVDEEFVSFVKRRFMDMPFVEGDMTLLSIFGSAVPLVVTRTKPHGPVKILETSHVQVLSEPTPEKKGISLVTYEDIGGLHEKIQRIREMVELPLRHPELFQRLGIEPPRGVFLYGPPGCGKTLLAKAVANESDANFYVISGPEIMSKFYGESEARLREIFHKAHETAPSIVFIDEMDAIAPKREEVTGEVERRVVAQLLSLMDGMGTRGNIIVIGATNRPNAIDPALRRPGRFDREIEIGVPDKKGRNEMLQIHTRNMPLAEDVDIKRLSDITHGYTGADISSLSREAAMKALRRYMPEINLEEERVPPEILDKMVVKEDDFLSAYREITPTAMREVYVEVPSVRLERSRRTRRNQERAGPIGRVAPEEARSLQEDGYQTSQRYTTLRPARMRQDSAGKSRRDRRRSELHLSQGSRDLLKMGWRIRESNQGSVQEGEDRGAGHNLLRRTRLDSPEKRRRIL